MSSVKYRLRAQQDIPHLGVKQGDLLTWDHGKTEKPFVIHRRCSLDMGTLLVALNEGILEPFIVTPGGALSRVSVEEAVGLEFPRLLLLHPQRRIG